MKQTDSSVFNFNKLGVAMSISLVLLGSGCAVVSKVPDSQAGVDQAIAELGQPKNDKDVLHYMEKGELLRRKNDHLAATESLLSADSIVRLWEEKAKSGGEVVLQNAAALLVNDSARDYEARDYEKVHLATRLAVMHLQDGDLEKARVEVKKMHERESIISEFRSKELDKAKDEIEKKGIKATSFKEIEGYPVETIDNPEVNKLKNSYESSYSNYLAGFVYEALGEPGLAAAGYRKAIELRPDATNLTSALEGLDQRVRRGGPPGMVDTLVLVEYGKAPQLKSIQLPIILPIPTKNGIDLVATPISWPTLDPMPSIPELSIRGGEVEFPVSTLTNLDLMARKAISDEMPSIILRSSIRAITRGAAQKAINNSDAANTPAGAIFSLIATVGTLVLEQADVRSWRNVPGYYAIGRAYLPAGKSTITVKSSTHNFEVSREIDLNGRYGVAVFTVAGSGTEVNLRNASYGPPNLQPVVFEEPAPAPVAPKKKKDPKKEPKKEPKKAVDPAQGKTASSKI